MEIPAHCVAQHGTAFLFLFVPAEQVGLPIPAVPILIIEIPGTPDSIALSVEEVIAKHHTLLRDRDVILYCACSGDTASVQAASSLRDKGLLRVWPLAGGVEAWHALKIVHEEFIGASEGQTIRRLTGLRDATSGRLTRSSTILGAGPLLIVTS